MIELLMSTLRIAGTLLYFAWLIWVFVGLPTTVIASVVRKSPETLRKSCFLFGAVTIALFVVSLVLPEASRVSGQPAPTRIDMARLLAGHLIVAIPMILPSRLLDVGAWRRLFYLAMVVGAVAVVALAIPMMQRTNSLDSVKMWIGTLWRSVVPGGAFVYLALTYRRNSPDN